MSTSLIHQALALREKGENEKAIELFRHHLSSQPQDLIARHNLAAAFGDVGRFNDAAKMAKWALDGGLDKPQTWLVYARALGATGRASEAEAAYAKVLSFDPVNIEALRELSQLIWMYEGDIERSLKPLDEAIENYPGASAVKIIRAEVAGQMGDTERQYMLMKACFEGLPKQGDMFFYMSKAALAAGHYTEALEHGRQAFASFPNDLNSAIHFVNCLLANGEAAQALPVVERFRSTSPFDQHLIALQATCWRMLGDSRYSELYNYDRFVAQLPLGAPTGWNSVEAYVDQLEKELDEEHLYAEHPFFLSVRHGSQIASITSSKRPAMKAFSQAIEAPVKSYLASLTKAGDPLQSRLNEKADLFSAWSVRLKSEGFHVNHVHQEGWLSSACHIRLAPTMDDETKAGWLKFGEPGPHCDPTLSPDRYIKPQRGMIVIFPSYVWHGTVPFEGNADRLTVAADLVPGTAS